MLQILVNVLHNAKYACDEGGQRDKCVTVRIRRRGDKRVQIEVADNGVGIYQRPDLLSGGLGRSLISARLSSMASCGSA